MRNVRQESQVFNDLEVLCSTPGYFEVIALICLKDIFIHAPNGDVTIEVIADNHDKSKLSRAEISVLIALACKNNSFFNEIDKRELFSLVTQTYVIMEELHDSMFNVSKIDYSNFDNFSFAELGLIREAVFYSGEGAFKHQYRDLSLIRYEKDNAWLEKNKGFRVEECVEIISYIETLQVEKINRFIKEAGGFDLESYVEVFKFNFEQIAVGTGINEERVKSFLIAMSAKSDDGLAGFNEVDSFNYRNAFPIINIGNNEYVVYQVYSLWESLYESPFFWFNDDDSYREVAKKNRGDYAEFFAYSSLIKVFGESSVFKNVNLYKGKSVVGEIDVLVVCSGIVLVIQAKSKRLTINARKGEVNAIKKDFNQAVQSAYNQAISCISFLGEDGVDVVDENDCSLDVSNNRFFFPICLLSDYYPSLTTQARELLEYRTTEHIMHPYIMDVFLLDLLTEMLDTPVFFLDYLYKRCFYNTSIIATHELVVLSLYLKTNLYFEEKFSLAYLEENISADLELAMLVRRDNYQGERTPSGMLTIHNGKYTGLVIDSLKK